MLMVFELATCAVCVCSCTIAAASAPNATKALPPITAINAFTATPPSSPGRHKVSAQPDTRLNLDWQLTVVRSVSRLILNIERYEQQFESAAGADDDPTRSSDRPASSRDHCGMGRPSIRVLEPSTIQSCGQPAGESSQGSWRPYTVRSIRERL